LKDFKQINDQYGHQAGDAVLVELARRMRGALRVTDTIARMGGDEFAMILKSARCRISLNWQKTLSHVPLRPSYMMARVFLLP
jgi:diguanylate cyclase (GGDEF)-like protein